MKVFLLVVSLSWNFPAAAYALAVSSGSLPSAVGFLQCEPYPDVGSAKTLAVLSEAFESFSIAPSTSVYRHWMTPGLEKPFPDANGEMFIFQMDDPHYVSRRKARSYIEDPSTQRVFTVWSDTGFEVSKQAIVVWKRAGKQLHLEAVLDTALLAGIGSSSIGEVRPIRKGKTMLIGRTEGGDGGDNWGTVWVALWTEPRHLEILWSMDYSGNEETQRDLVYEFDRKNMKLNLQRRERKLTRTPDGEGKYAEDEVLDSWTLDVGFMVP